jgi:hypothetical protein
MIPSAKFVSNAISLASGTMIAMQFAGKIANKLVLGIAAPIRWRQWVTTTLNAHQLNTAKERSMGQEKPGDQPPPPPTLVQWWSAKIRSVPGGGLLFALVPLLILGYFGWYYYGAEHLDRTLYSLREENIELTPQPAWIHGDVRAEVYRSGALSHVSLLEPQASATIAHAFDAHTWIKTTNRVRKTSGGKVKVDVVYRKPAAMVYFRRAPAIGSQEGAKPSQASCFPVDEEGFVLPSDDFAPADVHNYFVIFAPGATPAGGVGMAFGDDRILEALKLCHLLEPQRTALKLACVYVEADALEQQLGALNSWILRVETVDNRNIIWGHAPGKETKDEPRVEEKIASMQTWLQAPASASDIAVLDLRFRRSLTQRLVTVPNTGR